MIERFLRAFPYLEPVRINNLYDRLLKESNGTMLCLYNKTRDTYELHSLKSFNLNGESLNAVLEDDMLHGWLVLDYLANNLNKFGIEVESDRILTNETLEHYSDRGLELLSTRALKTVEQMVGREI
jgi:hypothetical protein